jgi:hypothetical protein
MFLEHSVNQPGGFMLGKERFALVTVVALAILVVAGSVASAQGRCSVATLKGSYGLVEQGTVLVALPPPMDFLPPAPYPTANVAIVTYDGAGNLSATYRAVFGGVPLPAGSLTGTYTVGPDCTYTDDVPEVMMKRAGVIVGNGTNQEVRTVSTVPWIVATGTRTKMTVGNCSVGDLKGDYLLASQGVVGPPPNTRQPVAGVGLITYNGRGNFYGSETVNFAGTPLQNPFTGIYAVNANCTVSGEVLDAIGTSHLTGVLIGQGANQELRFLITDPGTVLVGTIKRQ